MLRCIPRTGSANGKPPAIDFDELFLDPCTGDELGRRTRGDLSQGSVNLVPFVYEIHTTLAAGAVGRRVLGVVALAWTVNCFVGFYLTLPAGTGRYWRRWRPAWLVKWRSRAFRIQFDLHRAAGLWLWPLLFTFAWSAVSFTLNGVYRRAMGVRFERPLGPPARANGNPRLHWREAQAVGERLMAQQAALHGFTVTRPFGLAYRRLEGQYAYSVLSSRDIRRGAGTPRWSSTAIPGHWSRSTCRPAGIWGIR